MNRTGLFFTAKARVAAAKARRRRAAAAAATKGDLEVFAFRTGNGFGWQIRKFGGLVLLSGEDHFFSAAAARAAGKRALEALNEAGSEQPVQTHSSVLQAVPSAMAFTG